VVEAPREVILDFGEPVSLVPDALRLSSSEGRQVSTSAAALSENGRRMTAGVAEELASGVYRVAWQVRAEDGDLDISASRMPQGTESPIPTALAASSRSSPPRPNSPASGKTAS
jgi:hypothetical protein